MQRSFGQRDWHKLLLALSHLHLKIWEQNSKHFLTWILREKEILNYDLSLFWLLWIVTPCFLLSGRFIFLLLWIWKDTNWQRSSKVPNKGENVGWVLVRFGVFCLYHRQFISLSATRERRMTLKGWAQRLHDLMTSDLTSWSFMLAPGKSFLNKVNYQFKW